MKVLAPVIVAAAASACLLVPDRAQGAPTRPAAAFVDSVGVMVHMSYDDTSYRRVDRVRSALRDLGVHHVRDSLVPQRPDAVRALETLAQDGIRLQLIVSDLHKRRSIRSQLAYLRAHPKLVQALQAVEGSNEYDLAGDPNWIRKVRRDQRELFTGVEGDPAFAGVDVLGPVIARIGNRGRTGSLARYLDTANIHSYGGGFQVEDRFRDDIDDASKVAGAKARRVVQSETGYHGAFNDPFRDQRAVPQDVAAIYLQRTLLEGFRLGVERTYLYELLDEKPDPSLRQREQHFGLLRNDFSPKRGYTAIRSLLAPLRAAMPGEGPAVGVRLKRGRLLRMVRVQAKDETFVMAWRKVSVWDQSRERRKTPQAAPVTLTVPPGSRVMVRRPDRPAGWTSVPLRGRQAIVKVDGAPKLIRVTPAR